MLIFIQQWHDILINFIIDLLNSNKYINIIIIVDRLMKLWHLIALKFLDVETVVDVFIKNVFKLHELSDMIVSDCDSQFVSMFWKTLCIRLKIEAWLSIIHYSEMNDQTENMNLIMKQYLWMYCSYFQDDWKRWLFLMKFLTNNMKNELISMILFYATYEQDSWFEFKSWTEIDNHDLTIKWL